MKAPSVLLAALCFGLPAYAHAQVDLQVYSDAMVSTGLNNTMIAAINAQTKGSGPRSKSGRRAAVSAAAARTRFTPSLARRRAQSGKFVAALAKASPDLGKSLAPAFRGDPVAFARPIFDRYGLRTDDVADLTAVYLATSWYGAHGKAGDPTRGEVAAVRDQIRRAYASAPKLRGASDAAKQSVGEGSLYLAFLNDALIETMRAHPEAKARLMQEIAAGAKATLGLDLRSMRLTTAGLARR